MAAESNGWQESANEARHRVHSNGDARATAAHGSLAKRHAFRRSRAGLRRPAR